jgi:hypothetical protein
MTAISNYMAITSSHNDTFSDRKLSFNRESFKKEVENNGGEIT